MQLQFPKTGHFDVGLVRSKIMGPNTLKLCEELLDDPVAGFAGLAGGDSVAARLAPGSVVLDLGSGSGISSVMLAREYGFATFAADLWSDPGDHMRFFESLGLTNRDICPVKADANALPFATGFFDAVVSVDSYSYFGRDPEFLGGRLLPFVRLFAYTALVNLNLAVFNLIPLPPLDGYHVFNDLLFNGRIHLSERAFDIGMVVVMILAAQGILGRIISAVVYPAQDLLLTPIKMIWG